MVYACGMDELACISFPLPAGWAESNQPLELGRLAADATGWRWTAEELPDIFAEGSGELGDGLRVAVRAGVDFKRGNGRAGDAGKLSQPLLCQPVRIAQSSEVRSERGHGLSCIACATTGQAFIVSHCAHDQKRGTDP